MPALGVGKNPLMVVIEFMNLFSNNTSFVFFKCFCLFSNLVYIQRTYNRKKDA